MIQSEIFYEIKDMLLLNIDAEEVNISYRHYSSGDFGSLDQIIFESIDFGGGIDIWGNGQLGIEFINYVLGEEQICIMIDSEDKKLKDEKLKELVSLLLQTI